MVLQLPVVQGMVYMILLVMWAEREVSSAPTLNQLTFCNPKMRKATLKIEQNNYMCYIYIWHLKKVKNQ